jgi:outer membrane protein assembly factor BamB
MLVAAVGAAETHGALSGPAVTSLSTSTSPRSGRVLIVGTGFGAAQGTSTVTVGGVVAPVTRWSETEIHAYVPEAAPLGPVGAVVTVDGASSSALPLTVTARQTTGRIKWSFAVEGQYIDDRPAVGPDGTVFVVDSSGDEYALTPDGGLKWVVPYAGSDGPASVGADGTSYVGSSNTIKAIGPDGTIKWTFTEQPTDGQGVIAGPTVGPDGNIYVVTNIFGLGVFALSPAGHLLWSNVGDPRIQERAQSGAEIVFSPAHNSFFVGFDETTQAPAAKVYGFSLAGAQLWSASAGGGADGVFMQRQRQPETGPDGTVYETTTGGANGWGLYAFSPTTGALKWLYSPYPSNEMSPPSAGPDGSVYFARSLSFLESVTPNGVSRWSFFDGSLIDQPVVSPQGAIVVAGSRPNFGIAGSVRGWNSSNGSPLWQVDLPDENGGYQVVETRPRFAVDGQTAYVGTAILASNAVDQYSYLYAVNTAGAGNLAPSIVITHSAGGTNGWNRVAPVQLGITASDPDDGLAGTPLCTDRLGLASVALSVAGTLSRYHATVSGDGIHRVTCTATDLAGRATAASRALKLDTTAPSIAVTHRLVPAGYTMRVTASDSTSGLAAAPHCADNGKAVRLTAAGSAWTVSVKTGTHSITCSVADRAGWRSTARDSFTS